MAVILPAPRSALFVAAPVLAILVAGCGLKGDLYLPDESGTPTRSEAPPPGDDVKDGDDREENDPPGS